MIFIIGQNKKTFFLQFTFEPNKNRNQKTRE